MTNTRRRGIIPVIAAIMAVVALVVAIALIVGIINALGQSFMGRVSGLFSGGSFSGSYETTNLLNGIPIETSGKMAIENHMALQRGALNMNEHFVETKTDQIFASNPVGLKMVKSPIFKAYETSSFIDELGGNLPADDETWYINQRWCYKSGCFMGKVMGDKKDYLRKRVVVTNPRNGRSVVASVLDWGPAGWTGRVAGISPEIAAMLGADTDATLQYGWAVDQNVPLGPVNKNAATGGGSGTSTGPGFSRTPRGFPRFLQYEGPWAQLRYGDCTPTYQAGQNGHQFTQGTFADAACGPSALANVVKYYAEKGQLKFKPAYTAKYGNTISPQTIGELADKGGFRVCGSGTESGFIKAIGEQYFNLKVSAGVSWSRVVEALKSGIPVIGNMGAGVFTSEGHFVVLYGIDEANDKIYSSDSYTRNVTEAKIDAVHNQGEAFFVVAVE